MYRRELILVAIVLFVFALVLTGLGGWADMLGKPMIMSKQHAWNDGIFLLLGAIFVLLLARA